MATTATSGRTNEPATAPAAALEHGARQAVADMFGYIRAQGDADYIGEPVSQLEHTLQCAGLAQAAGADDETVLGALLHDVGRFVPAATTQPQMECADGARVGIHAHEAVGEAYLRHLGFADKICALVGAHVVAKRYLTAVEPAYYAALSEASKRTLEFQGGVFNDDEVREAQKDPWLADKLAVRRWDDQAKVPGAATLPLDAYEEMAVRSLVQSRQQRGMGGYEV